MGTNQERSAQTNIGMVSDRGTVPPSIEMNVLNVRAVCITPQVTKARVRVSCYPCKLYEESQ